MTDFSVSTNASSGHKLFDASQRRPQLSGNGSFPDALKRSVAHIRPSGYSGQVADDIHSQMLEEIEKEAGEQQQRRQQQLEADLERAERHADLRSSDVSRIRDFLDSHSKELSEHSRSFADRLQQLQELDSENAPDALSLLEDGARGGLRQSNRQQSHWDEGVPDESEQGQIREGSALEGGLHEDGIPRGTESSRGAELHRDEAFPEGELNRDTHPSEEARHTSSHTTSGPESHPAANENRPIDSSGTSIAGLEESFFAGVGEDSRADRSGGETGTAEDTAALRDKVVALSSQEQRDDTGDPTEAEKLGESGERRVDTIREFVSDLADSISEKIEDLAEARERFEEVVEHLKELLERMESLRGTPGGGTDGANTAIDTSFTDALRSLGGELDYLVEMAGQSGGANAPVPGSGGDAASVASHPQRQILSGSGDSRSLNEALGLERDSMRSVDDIASRLAPEREREDSSRAAEATGQSRRSDIDARVGRLAERLEELSASLRGTDESEGDRNGRSGEMTLDVRDRRGTERPEERYRPVEQSDGAQNRGGERDATLEGTAQRQAENVVDRREGSESERSTDRFAAMFDRAQGQGSSESAARSDGAEQTASTARSHASEELARALREQDNDGIIRRARVILRDHNEGELRLHLKPEGLGDVRIRMELNEKRVGMRVLVENSSVRDVFEANLSELQAAFEADGFETGTFSVSVEGESSDNAATGGRADGGESRRSSSLRAVNELDDSVPMLDLYDGEQRHINLMA